MPLRPFLITVGIVFALVGLVHLYRALAALPAVVGGTNVPIFWSWITAVVTAFLSFQAFRHARR